MQGQKLTGVLGASVLALCAITDPALAQRKDGAAQETASAGKKTIPWDEPGKPAGVPAIDEYRATGVKTKVARPAREAKRRQPAAETRAIPPAQQQHEKRGPTAERPRRPVEPARIIHTEVKDQNDREERRRLEVLERNRVKAKAEADARADAEAELRARIIAEAKAKALAEEQRRLEAEKSRDRFVRRPDTQIIETPSAPGSPAAAATQGPLPLASGSGPTAPETSHVGPDATGSIIVSPQLAEPSAGAGLKSIGHHEREPVPTARAEDVRPSETWRQSICRWVFFGALPRC